jgi:transcriptional regulator with PAS, ATPase and Fis domain
MKSYINLKININLYFLIPLVSGLFGFLSVVSGSFFSNNSFYLYLTGCIFGFCSGLFTFYVLKLFLEPAEKLAEKIKKKEAVKNIKPEKSYEKDQLGEIKKAFFYLENILEADEKHKYFPDIITNSNIMKSELKKALQAAPADVSVFITGESGTGKELVCDAIVSNSKRKNLGFVKINCSAIPQNLVESELFGYSKGAFTGADSNKKGKFLLADNGTIFLDEIGDMPLDVQAKLLRVLENSEISPLGSEKTIKINVRVIAAANKDPETLIKEKKLRQDLFYRLSVIMINLPPLRQRKEDIEALSLYFLKKFTDSGSISKSALELLNNYDWPGNIRELKNIIERAGIYSGKNEIKPENLPPEIAGLNQIGLGKNLKSDTFDSKSGKARNLDETISEIEISIIEKALENNLGIQSKAALELGITQRSLWNRIKKYSIDVSKYKN